MPDLPGVIAVGGSREEMEELIRDAIEFHLEGMRQEGFDLPIPVSVAGSVDVHPPA